MKKKTIIIIVSVVAVAIVSLLAFKKLFRKDPPVTFETVKVEQGEISNTVTATGTIEAIKTVNVGTQVSGIIQSVYVDFNDNVKNGQLLAKLDETSLKAQLEQSQASLDQAQAQLEFQKATYDRLKALFEKNLIAKADYDQAVFNYDNSRAALSNAKSALDRAKVNLAYATITSPIDGVVLNRAIEAGQTVAASFNTPTLFTIVNDLTHMEVQTSVDEADIGKVKDGQRVEFTVDAYPDLKFEGSVSQVRLQPVITNNVVTYVVILNAPNPDKKLMPGMTASATIYVDEKANTLVLSGKALRFKPSTAYLEKERAARQNKDSGYNTARAGTTGRYSQEQAQQSFEGASRGMNQGDNKMNGSNKPADNMKIVWVKNANGGIRPARVTTGIDNGTNVEILSGLKAGDEVIISMNDPSDKSATAAGTNAPRRSPFML